MYYTSGAATQYAAYVENQWLTGEEAATGRGTQGPLFVSRTIVTEIELTLYNIIPVPYHDEKKVRMLVKQAPYIAITKDRKKFT